MNAIKKNGRFRILVLAFCIAIAMASIATGCSPGGASENSGSTPTAGDDNNGNTDTGKKFKVGFANSSLDNPWRVGIQSAIEKNFAKYPEVELVTNEAGEDPVRMNHNIEDMIAQGVDLILCCTVEAEPFEVSAKLCEEKGIPLILVDRGINSDKYTCFISQSNFQIGYDSAEWAAKVLTEKNGSAKGKAVELQGVPGNLPAEQRKESFHEYVEKNYPDIEIVAAQPTDYSRANAMEVMENILQSQKEIDVVYTHEDEIALGAIKALQEANRTEGVMVIGDGGSRAALEAIKAGSLAATATYSPIDFGFVAVQTAMKFLNGEKIDKVVEFTGKVVTAENVDEYLAQMDESGEDFVSTREE
jgi:ribose transport system substrate-binding protein